MDLQKLATSVMLVALMSGAGLDIDRGRLIGVLKDYKLIGRALLANFIIVPVIAVLVTNAFRLSGYVATGVLLMAIAPGVPFLVQAAGRKPGGSLGFAATLAFVMPAISIVTIPLMAPIILPAAAEAHLPFQQLLITLGVFQLLPLVVGILVADRFPKIAQMLRLPDFALFALATATLLVLVGPALVKAVTTVYGSRAGLASLVIVSLCVVVGWLLGGPHIEFRRTLSIATCLRNIGTCALIALTDFRGTLVVPVVWTYFIVQLIVSLLVRVYLHRKITMANAQ